MIPWEQLDDWARRSQNLHAALITSGIVTMILGLLLRRRVRDVNPLYIIGFFLVWGGINLEAAWWGKSVYESSAVGTLMFTLGDYTLSFAYIFPPRSVSRNIPAGLLLLAIGAFNITILFLADPLLHPPPV